MGIISGVTIKSGFSRVSSSNDSSLNTINTKVIKDNTKEKATNMEARMNASSAINNTTSSATSGTGVSTIDTEMSTEGFSGVQSANGDVSAMQAEELQAYIQSLKGKMSQEQYDKFIEGIKDNLDIQIKEHEDILNGNGNNVGLIKKYNELNKIVERANRGTDTSITYSNSLEFKNECSKYGVENLSELINIRDDLGQKVSGLSMELNNLKSQKESAKYDYIGFLKDFDSFDYESFSNSDLADFDKDAAVENIEKLSGNLADSAVVDTRTAYSYEAYKSKHPNVSPLQFVMMLEKLHGNEDYVVLGISDVESLTVVAQLYEYYPDLAKTYEYLYSQSPKKANEFINNCKYELNAFEGQLKAKEFFDDLSDLEGTNLDEAVANELGVTVEGLKDGLISFGEGVGYTVEAGETGVKKILKKLGLYDGDVEENRLLSSEEYKRMYILQMLMNKQDKINAGIIVKDDNGNYVNGDGSKILDYSKTFKGKFLSNNYEISQGIGNMIPSVMMTVITPTFGSVALGVSAGGNAYHGAMVEGQSYASSLLYGVFTGSSEAISERLLGGLPGLSDVQVTGLKTYLKAAAKEGVQESFQNILDKIYRVSAMGESLPTTAEEWKEFASDTFKQGIYGMITAGIMNVPSLAINSTRINSFKNELNANNLSYDDFLEAVKKGYDLPDIGELEAIAYFGDEYIELSTKIKDNSQSSIPVEASNSDVKSFNSMQDAANYFSDPNLYLVGVLYDKYVNKDINIARDNMYELRRQVYLNEPTAIEKVKSYLNMEELAIYQNIEKNKNSGIQQSWIDSLTESEKFSIRSYAEMFGAIDAYDAMSIYNYDSNGSSVTLPELMRKGFLDGDSNIDSAIEKFGILPEEIQVYRTVASDALTSQFGELDLDNLKSLIGKTYKDKAYMSTSLIESSARSANFGEGQTVLMKIMVPTDANYGAYIESLSNLSYNQMEFLIKKNSTSTIENAYLDEDGRIVVEMKLFTPFDNSRTTSKPLLPIVEKLINSGKFADDELNIEYINNKFIEDNYKFYLAMATNESDSAKAILEKIKNGYEPNEVDLMELIESDPVKLDQYRKIYDIRSRLRKEGVIKESDVNYLLATIGFLPESGLTEIERLSDDLPIEVQDLIASNPQYFIDNPKLLTPEILFNSSVLSANSLYEEAKSQAKSLLQFLAYRSHLQDHVIEVKDFTLAILEEYKQYIPEIDLMTTQIAALYHDTGMNGNYRIAFHDDNGLEIMQVSNDDGSLIRSKHPEGSALYILNDREALESIGVNVEEAALLALSHSKSTSKIIDFSSEEQWVTAIENLNKMVQDDINNLTLKGLKFDISVFGNYDSNGNFIFKEGMLERITAEAVALRRADAATTPTESTTNQAGDSYNYDYENKILKIVDGTGNETVVPFEISRQYYVGEHNIDIVPQAGIVSINVHDINLDPESTFMCIEERILEEQTMYNTIMGCDIDIVFDGEIEEDTYKIYKEQLAYLSEKFGKKNKAIFKYYDELLPKVTLNGKELL